ncbi:MAG TPA: phospholipase D-like domain-containing protein, partial [Archangium sp.]|nr:phospholipase D-like domain-containing protein [Archangium sp.]
SGENTQAFSHLVVSPNNARATLKAFIQGARHRLCVYNQEYKDDSINTLILEAKQRGVDVQVLGAQDNGNEPALKKFREAGIPARELTKYYLHAKAIVADDRVFIGSQNFSTEALDDNRELGKLIDDPELVQQLVHTFESDFASTT